MFKGIEIQDEYWNASTNYPPLTSGDGRLGRVYIVNVAGTTNLDGINSWAVNDWVVFGKERWHKLVVANPSQMTIASFATLLASLPTTLPATTNQPWLNGGVLSLS